jgi:hypothetical protein
VRVLPSCGVPVTAGGAVFDGGIGATVIGPTADDAAPAEPIEFVAVTVTTIVLPTSALATVYVLPVAPAISLQFAPVASHCRHWYAYEKGDVPLQAPGSAERIFPSCVVPETLGAVVFCGPTDATVAVASDVALAGPTAFVAVTTTRIVDPASGEVS